MPRLIAVPALAALLLLPVLAAAPVAAAPASGSFTLSGSSVEVYNLAGAANLVAGEGNAVTVEVRSAGRDAAKLDVTTLGGGSPALVVRYPSERVIYRPGSGSSPFRGSFNTRIKVRPDGRFGSGIDGTSGGRRVEIKSSGSGLEAWADLTVRIPKGRQVTLHLGVGRVDARNIDGNLKLETGAGNVAVQGLRGELNVETGSGHVTASRIEGSLAVGTGSGDVEVEGASGSRVDIDTGSGSVTATGVTTRQISCDTGSGRVDLVDLRCPRVSVDTGSGSVRVQLMTTVEVLDVDTGSGSVTIESTQDLDATLSLETGSGGIDCNFPMNRVRRDDGELVGVIGSGRGQITIDTGSGSIRLARLERLL